MQYRISYVQPPLPPGLWQVIGECLAPAIEHTGGRYAVDDVLQNIASGRYSLVVVHSDQGDVVAALTATVISYPQIKAFEVGFLGGHEAMRWGRDMLETVETLAKATGCSRLQFRGRKEWGRVLEKDGYTVASTLYEKVIEPCGSAENRGSSAH